MPKRYGNSSGMYAPRQGFYFAPNAGLTYANGIANGVNQGMQNMLKARQMAMQQQYMRARAQALQTQANGIANWRNAIAEKARKDAMDADMSKVDMLRSMSKSGQYNPDLVKKFESKYMGQVLENMKPEEAQAARQRFDSMASQGQVAPEFSQYTDTNAKETKALDIQTNAGARQYAADKGYQGRIDSANIVAKAATARQGAQIDANTKKYMAGIYATSYRALQKDYDNADKPVPGTPPPSQDDIAKKRQDILNAQMHIDDQYRSVTGESLMPKHFTTKEDAQNALPGDTVQNPKGDIHQMLPDKTWNPNPIAPPSGAQPIPQPSPSANTTMNVPPGGMGGLDDDEEDDKLAGVGSDDEEQEA